MCHNDASGGPHHEFRPEIARLERHVCFRRNPRGRAPCAGCPSVCVSRRSDRRADATSAREAAGRWPPGNGAPPPAFPPGRSPRLRRRRVTARRRPAPGRPRAGASRSRSPAVGAPRARRPAAPPGREFVRKTSSAQRRCSGRERRLAVPQAELRAQLQHDRARRRRAGRRCASGGVSTSSSRTTNTLLAAPSSTWPLAGEQQASSAPAARASSRARSHARRLVVLCRPIEPGSNGVRESTTRAPPRARAGPQPRRERLGLDPAAGARRAGRPRSPRVTVMRTTASARPCAASSSSTASRSARGRGRHREIRARPPTAPAARGGGCHANGRPAYTRSVSKMPAAVARAAVEHASAASSPRTTRPLIHTARSGTRAPGGGAAAHAPDRMRSPSVERVAEHGGERESQALGLVERLAYSASGSESAVMPPPA